MVKIVKGVNDLATIAPDLLIDWDYDKNDKQPDEIKATSTERVHWKCHKCGKEWTAQVYIALQRKRLGCRSCGMKYNLLRDLKSENPTVI